MRRASLAASEASLIVNLNAGSTDLGGGSLRASRRSQVISAFGPNVAEPQPGYGPLSGSVL